MMTLYERLTAQIEAEEINAASIAGGRDPLPGYIQPAIDICRFRADAVRDTRDWLPIETIQREV